MYCDVIYHNVEDYANYENKMTRVSLSHCHSNTHTHTNRFTENTFNRDMVKHIVIHKDVFTVEFQEKR